MSMTHERSGSESDGSAELSAEGELAVLNWILKDGKDCLEQDKEG
jgi:hypothetical protein